MPRHPFLTLLLLGGVALATSVPPALGQGTPVYGSPDVAERTDSANLRTLTAEDYERWERLENFSLSPDGRWLTYRVRRESGGSTLHLRLLDSDSVITASQGSGTRFSEDGRWVAFSHGPSPGERQRLEEAGESTFRSLGLLDTETGERLDLEGASTYRFSPNARFLAYKFLRRSGGDGRTGTLVVRDLQDGSEMSFGNVTEFDWAPEDGAILAFVTESESGAPNGISLYDAGEGRLRSLASSDRDYRGLSWRSEGGDLAVFERSQGSGNDGGRYSVRVWRGLGGPLGDMTPPGELHLWEDGGQGLPEGLEVSRERSLRWSRSHDALLVGLEPRPGQGEAKEDNGENTEAEEGGSEEDVEDEPSGEPPDLEIWHSRDLRPIPQQRVDARWEENATTLAAWHLDEDRLVPLVDEPSRETNLMARDRLVVHLDRTPYERDRMFGPSYRDVHVVDVRTGERERIAERVQYFFGASPEGRYILYLRGDDYWVYDRAQEEHRSLTEGLPTSFVDLENDHTVEQKPPYGYAGWTPDEEAVLIYDRYDVWKVSVDGSGGARLTEGAEEEVRFRYIFLKASGSEIDLEEGLYLAMHGRKSKHNGFAYLEGSGPAEPLHWVDGRTTRLARSENGERLAFVQESFHEPPNVYVAGTDLQEPRRVTDLNPFQSDYHWGRAELLDYETEWGDSLQAALFYPADYDPGRKYPMIVHPYERRSGTIHSYEVPSEREPYNTTVWTQRGYFVLAPDIAYRPRQPGVSAKVALDAAVDRAVAVASVDEERVGLIGHSWGGYQTAFVLTQTDRFAAGMAGAPLTNLISMYLSFFWNTGDPDARIFEMSQARMEVPWWEDYDSYVANSPVHHIEGLNTPLLMAFGTEDGAVDFHQGVEFYNAARRAGRDFVLLVYEGEGHSLSRRPNRVDLHRRILEWFDHYLKGEPAPDWIIEGVPYLEQRESQGGNSTGGRL